MATRDIEVHCTPVRDGTSTWIVIVEIPAIKREYHIEGIAALTEDEAVSTAIAVVKAQMN